MAFKFYSFIILSIIIFSIDLSSQNDFKKRPNIVLVLTDDQDVVLQGLIPMTYTLKNIGLKGMTFMNAFTSTPVCCPSRASILSGQYAHNHKTINNTRSGGCYGEFWKDKIEPRALPVQLNSNGYETFFAGKYLNEYFTYKVPPGWDHFYGLHGNSRYYNYTLTENGINRSYSDEYLTDVLSEKLFKFLNERNKDKPFFAMVAPPSPHAPYTPAPRHNETFDNIKALKTPNFNMISGPLDKHWLVSGMSKPIPDNILKNLDLYFRKRWQSLLAVDELIQNLIITLEKNSDIDNTYIIFTSDNGYHIGQFAQPFDKRQPYETDIRIPLLIRGPNIQKKSINDYPVVLIDLFPTILEWAKINETGHEDGVSFNSYLLDNQDTTTKTKTTTDKKYKNILNDKNFHRQILIEYWGEGSLETYNPECQWEKYDNLFGCTKDADCHCQDTKNNTYSCVRHFAYNTNKIYCEFQDSESFVEAYDLHVDPYEIKNLGYELLPSERAMYSLALQNLTRCIEESCKHTRF